MSPKLLILFSTGFHWRIFLLSRANRLCSVFSTGLKDFGVPRVSVNLLSLARSKMAMIRLPRALLKNWLFTIYFRWGEGNPTSVLGSQPIIWLLSLSPSDVRRLEFTKCEHLVYLLCDPHSLLTVTFWLLDTLIQYGRIVSVLPLRLRELSRDNIYILKWEGAREIRIFLGFIYFVLTYVHVFSLLLSSENIYGTKPC